MPQLRILRSSARKDFIRRRQFVCFRHRVEISGGLGPTANKVFRIGLMGQNATPEKVDLVLKVLKEGLENVGYKPKL